MTNQVIGGKRIVVVRSLTNSHLIIMARAFMPRKQCCEILSQTGCICS
jgi:hypothetical protein